MKIAHLSDLHICKKSRPGNIKNTELLLQYALAQGTDHFVITGDLIHLANDEDFYELRTLFNKYDLMDPNRLTLVIGNHDIYGGVHLAEDVVKFPQACLNVDYNKKVESFNKYFFEAFENCYVYSTEMGYPFVKVIDNVALIGINSTTHYSILKNPFASKGFVNKYQIAGIKHIMSRLRQQNKIKIVMMHHHFKRQNLNDSLFRNSMLKNVEDLANNLWRKNRLLKVLRRYQVDLILHGHEHFSGEYVHRKLHMVNAGGTIDKNEPGELKINFIDIVGNAYRTEVRHLRIHEMAALKNVSREHSEQGVLVS